MLLWLLKLGITMLIHNKDDIEFVTEFPCFLGHPVWKADLETYGSKKFGTFVSGINNLKHIIWILNVATFKFKDKILIFLSIEVNTAECWVWLQGDIKE